MVKLALVDRTVGSSVIPNGSAANLWYQTYNTQAHSLTLEQWFSVTETVRMSSR